MRLILLIVVLMVLFGGIGGPYMGAPWPHSYGFGGAGAIIVILLVLAVFGYV